MSELKTNKIPTNDQNNVAIDTALGLKSYDTAGRDALTSVTGDIIYNTTEAAPQYYNGSSWISMKTFLDLDVDVLLVAGGGGGASDRGGGGGAGGVFYATAQSLTRNTNYTVTVGAGGNGGAGGGANNGSVGYDSDFASFTSAKGGGYGGSGS